MKILVTGAAGFVGSHLVDRLLRDGHSVIGLDNLMTGSRFNLHDALRHERFTFCVGDVRDPIRPYVDAIYNLACPASPRHYQADPHTTFTTSVLGALRIAEYCAINKVRVVQASTSEVYGDPTQHPQTEEYWGTVNPIGPRACYDEGKRGAETVLVDAWRKFAYPLQIVRIFNTYGPRMAFDDGRVVSSYIDSALRGAPLAVFGSGEQTRSFCYVDDLIDGLVGAMNLPCFDGPINIGNPVELSMLELVNVIQGLLGKKVDIRYAPLPIDDPKRRCPDISKARRLLAYEPKVSLQEGVRRTMEDFRKRMAADLEGGEANR